MALLRRRRTSVVGVVIVIVFIVIALIIIRRQSLPDTERARMWGRESVSTTSVSASPLDATDSRTGTNGSITSAAGARLERTVTIDGMNRNYTVFMPRTLNENKQPQPILFAYHPAAALVTFMEEKAPFHLASGAESFVVVYPEGYGKTFNAGGCCGAAYEKNVDDVAFFKAILADVATIVPIRDKAYITGFSNGSLMTFRLVCEVPQLIAAAVPYAAARDMSGCVDESKVPLLYINGGEDELSLTGEGGSQVKFAHAVDTLVPPFTALDQVAKRNGCSVSHQLGAGIPAIDASCEVYAGCAAAPVSMCIIPRLGHAWPGSGSDVANATGMQKRMAEKMGPYRPELDSTGPIVDFFLKY